jgi:hypothetical protein
MLRRFASVCVSASTWRGALVLVDFFGIRVSIRPG